MQQTISATLTQIQRLVKANTLLFTLREQENIPSEKGIEQIAWEGNQPAPEALHPIELNLIEQALTSGQIAYYENDGAGADRWTVMVVPVRADDKLLGTLTLGWQNAPDCEDDTIQAAP